MAIITNIMNQMGIEIKNSILSLKEKIEEFPGWAILISMICFYLYNGELNSVILLGVMIYASVLSNRYIRHRIEKETLDSLDLDRISNENKSSILDIISKYVENCFDRDVLFYAVINNDDYIDNETERRLLDELLDSALINMSDEMRLKLSKYVGSENLIRILGRTCMTIVTIFVANHNKNIYQKIENKKVEI